MKAYYYLGEKMECKNRISAVVWIAFITMFAVGILVYPEPCKKGVIGGILLCGRIIIPSLYPFLMCVLFILRSGILSRLNFLAPVTRRLFGVSPQLFWVLVFSLIGGYPLGAKLLDEAVMGGEISSKKAGVMLNYCINAGPAFLISAVGVAILGSQLLGIILFFSSILTSLLIAFAMRGLVREERKTLSIKQKISWADNFVSSSADAAGSVMGICWFVILFAAINEYIILFAQKLSMLKPLMYILEVTNATSQTNNIYVISFIISFGGICVWCQIFSLAKNIKINYKMFVFFRVLQGLLSGLITFFTVKLFNITVPVISKNGFVFSFSSSSTHISVSMLIMAIVFVLSLSRLKNTCNFLEDMV